jgi:putative phosphoesterase
MLNDIKDEILCVRGNCDTEVDQMVLDFPILADYAILYVGNRMIYVTHGHVYNKSNLPPMKAGDILLHGHTHVPVCEEIEDTGIMYMNPGSVSIPKENSDHGYMVITDERIEWKNLQGEVYKEYLIR